MSNRMKIEVDFNSVKVGTRLANGRNRAQKWLDNEVLKDSTPYVPRLTGALERSGISGTKIGSGEVVYNTPYARRQYYGEFQHSKQAHTNATRTWFETAKAINRAKWARGVKKIGGGG